MLEANVTLRLKASYFTKYQLPTRDLSMLSNVQLWTSTRHGSTFPQTSVPIDLSTAKVLIQRTGQEEFYVHYIRDLHSATYHWPVYKS